MNYSRAMALLFLITALSSCQRPANTEVPFNTVSGEQLAELQLAGRMLTGRTMETDPVDGQIILEAQAQQGNGLAQALIGRIYLFGGNGIKANPAAGLSWLQKAAAQNISMAQTDLGYAYAVGIGVEKDPATALELGKKAARQGDGDGMALVGDIYFNGWGVTKDDNQAVDWYRKGTERRSANAMMRLGDAYENGRGVTKDPVVGYGWYSLAATAASSAIERNLAVKRRDAIALLLLPDQLTLGQRMASAWKPGRDLSPSMAADDGAPAKPQPEAVKTAPTAAALPENAPILVRKRSTDITVEANGDRTSLFHEDILARNQSAAQKIAQQALLYNATMDQLEILDAYTQKADGRRVPVNLAAIQEQLAPGSPDLAQFRDERQKVILFPNVAAGDSISYTARYRSKPFVPGFFTLSNVFQRTEAINDVQVTVSVPAPMILQSETHEVRAEPPKTVGDRKVYEWHWSNPQPLSDDQMAVDPADRNPRFFVSSFKTYKQLGKAYADLAEPRTAVTPTVRKLAEEITAGTSDRRRQAELIYQWVSSHIRYVAVQLGNDGAIIPHAVDSIIETGYGDCKDHSALFTSLLRAKGIASQVVLINFGNSYRLADPPTFASLNHAINWLPDFNLYADTTLGVAPFGVLAFGEYGKPAIHADSGNQAILRTPLPAPGAAEITMHTQSRMAADGSLDGDSDVMATGAFAVGMRQGAETVLSSGVEQAAKNHLKTQGYNGTGSFEFEPPTNLSPSFRVTGHFHTNSRPDLLAGNSFAIPSGLAVGWQPGEDLLGPYNLMDVRGAEPTPCYPGRQIQEFSIELPKGKKPRELPKDVRISNKYLSYTSLWSQDGQIIKLRRELTSLVDAPVCVGEIRQLAAKALNDIRADSYSGLSLVNE